MIIDCAVETDKGPVRENNEDNYFLDGHISAGNISRSGFGMSSVTRHEIAHDIAVFDGMGGEEYGEVASGIAARILAEYFARGKGGDFEEYTDSVNSAILSETLSRGVNRMGTTSVHLHIAGEDASLCNIGDSRAYLFRYGKLRLMSSDHRVFDRTAGGYMLTQHLGIDPEEFVIEPYITRGIRLESGMIFVLCSDGLTDALNNESLSKLLEQHGTMPARQIADRLIRAAIAGKTQDNVTVAVVKVS